VFRPFQRLGDTDNRSGVGLGLAVARGFVQAVGGELDIEDTPGGGCTMVVRMSGLDPVSHPDEGRSPVTTGQSADEHRSEPEASGPATPVSPAP